MIDVLGGHYNIIITVSQMHIITYSLEINKTRNSFSLKSKTCIFYLCISGYSLHLTGELEIPLLPRDILLSIHNIVVELF